MNNASGKISRAFPLKKFNNRELSWLAFNERVLQEAQDENSPLLERIKFLAIVSTNLDEFFMVRVASLERKLKYRPNAKEEDGMKTDEVLYQIREWVLAQKAKQALVLKDLLLKLKMEGIYVQKTAEASDPVLLKYVKEKIFPNLKTSFFKGQESLSSLKAGPIHIFVRFKDKFAVITWADHFDRLVELSGDLSEAKKHFVLAERIIVSYISELFPNETVIEAFPFKVIRDAEFDMDLSADTDDFLSAVEEAIAQRAKLPVVRLEIDAPNISDGALFLANAYKLHSRCLYRYDAPLDLKILWRVHELPNFDHLKFREPPRFSLRGVENLETLMEQIEGKDILLHHPYDSFDSVVEVLKAAAKDPYVTSIYQTLYRAGRNSPIIEALIEAAKNKKKVYVFVELRARFDEARNIKISKELRKHGVKILRGFPDKKIHCKLTWINRKRNGEATHLVHIGTGNYNPATARLYTDLSLITTNRRLSKDAEKVFKSIKDGVVAKGLNEFVTAPVVLHRKLISWINSEIRFSKKGKPSHIIAKVNALVDIEVCEKLYEASRAGVKIDLVVRGPCGVRPGIPGMSENIRVISIVDRYLEHSRIYYFQNDGDPLVYLSSADWMPRNLHRRIEVAFPILDPNLQSYVRNVILETYLRDNFKARVLQPDGQWVMVTPKPNEPVVHAQSYFEKLSANLHAGTYQYENMKSLIHLDVTVPELS